MVDCHSFHVAADACIFEGDGILRVVSNSDGQLLTAEQKYLMLGLTQGEKRLSRLQYEFEKAGYTDDQFIDALNALTANGFIIRARKSFYKLAIRN